MEGYELNFHAYKMLYKSIFDQLTEMSIGTYKKLAHVSCWNKSLKKYSIHLLIIPVCTVFFSTQDKVQKNYILSSTKVQLAAFVT